MEGSLILDRLCFPCNRKGHYTRSSHCLSTTAAEPKRNPSELKTYAEDDTNQGTSTRYLILLLVPEKKAQLNVKMPNSVSVKVDTGAEVMTLVSETTWNSLTDFANSMTFNRLWSGPKSDISASSNDTRIFKPTCQEKSCCQNAYIIRDRKNSLLGFPVIKKLEMLSHICSIGKNIPALFLGLGTFSQGYAIKLKPDNRPFPLAPYAI